MSAEDDGTPTRECCGAFVGYPHGLWCATFANTKMTVSDLQMVVNERWSRQLDNPCHTSADAAHALLHITKAVGKLAAATNDAQHANREIRHDEVAKYLADIVICAARFANGVVNLDTVCAARIAEKFPVPQDAT